uniref:Uncharacterized protein n=1 Tax=Glossina palpalis gambiensis TaxID=67801 RepID=A0A1B0AW97_9MUSC
MKEQSLFNYKIRFVESYHDRTLSKQNLKFLSNFILNYVLSYLNVVAFNLNARPEELQLLRLRNFDIVNAATLMASLIGSKSRKVTCQGLTHKSNPTLKFTYGNLNRTIQLWLLNRFHRYGTNREQTGLVLALEGSEEGLFAPKSSKKWNSLLFLN